MRFEEDSKCEERQQRPVADIIERGDDKPQRQPRRAWTRAHWATSSISASFGALAARAAGMQHYLARATEG
jgi:hypothetical protein